VLGTAVLSLKQVQQPTLADLIAERVAGLGEWKSQTHEIDYLSSGDADADGFGRA
jgi:hypothetical protein